MQLPGRVEIDPEIAQNVLAVLPPIHTKRSLALAVKQHTDTIASMKVAIHLFRMGS
jgi:hypothetical protein